MNTNFPFFFLYISPRLPSRCTLRPVFRHLLCERLFLPPRIVPHLTKPIDVFSRRSPPESLPFDSYFLAWMKALGGRSNSFTYRFHCLWQTTISILVFSPSQKISVPHISNVGSTLLRVVLFRHNGRHINRGDFAQDSLTGTIEIILHRQRWDWSILIWFHNLYLIWDTSCNIYPTILGLTEVQNTLKKKASLTVENKK